MIELIDQSAKRGVRSLYDDRLSILPESLQQGDTVPLAVGVLNRIELPHNSLAFEPIDVSDWAIRATIETEVVASLETDSADPAVGVTEEPGDAEHNHKVTITLPPHRYSGSWTFTVDDVESGLIGYADSEAELKAIVEAISGVGAGNVEVVQTGDNEFLIEFIGDLALQLIDGIGADGSTLKVVPLKSGTMDLRTVGIAALFSNGATEKTVALTILGTPPAGTEQILEQRDILLRKFTGEYDFSQPIGILGTVYLSQVTGFVGGGATKLDGATTVGRALGTVFRVIVNIGDTPVLSEWRIDSGTADTNLAAGIIKPLDFDEDDNAVNLILVSGTAV